MRQACSSFLKLDFWVEKRSFQSGLWLPTLLILFFFKVYDQCFECLCFSCFLRKVFANVVANVFKPQGRNCPLDLKASLQSHNCCSFYFWTGIHVPWNPSFLPSFFLPPSFPLLSLMFSDGQNWMLNWMLCVVAVLAAWNHLTTIAKCSLNPYEAAGRVSCSRGIMALRKLIP